MSTLEVKFDEAQIARIAALLAANAERARDMTPAMEQIAQRITLLERDVFTSEGAAAGRPWQGLSPGYVFWKESQWPSVLKRQNGGPADRPGVFSGNLERSLEPGGRYAAKRVTKTSARVGSRAPHAHLFASGTKARSRGGSQPGRAITGVTAEAQAEFAAIIANYLQQGGGESRLGL